MITKFQNISICRIKVSVELFKNFLGNDIVVEINTIFESDDALLKSCEVKKGKKVNSSEILYFCELKANIKVYGINITQQGFMLEKVVELSDGKMPFQFAQYFLDEKQINEITLDYLTGRY